MPQCNHCHKKFKIGHGKGSLTTHLAAVEAANTKKLNSKSGKGKTNTWSKNKKRIAIIDGKHIRIVKCNYPKCGKLVEEGNLKKHKAQHKGAGKASRRNIQSESQFVKKLKRQNPNSLVFQTGTESGVPDIVLYKNSKLIFYEIKPTKQENEKNSRLKLNQVEWIKKNCLAKGNEAYLVFYKGPTSKLTFLKKLLTRKNIDKYG